MCLHNTKIIYSALLLASILLSACSSGGGDPAPGGGSAGGDTLYSIGGTVSGLTSNGVSGGSSGSKVVLQNNAADNLTMVANDSFTFPAKIAAGSAYNITILSQPTGQTCSVSNGSGTASGNVSNVSITCVTNTYSVGGNVTGLNGTVALHNSNGDTLPVSAAGSFTFPTKVPSGNTYSVTILTQPAGQICSVSTGSGTVSADNVTNVSVVCASNAYSVSGNISGLNGTVVLQDNNGDNQTVTTDGRFTFPTPVADGSPYNITVLTQPTGQSCSVASGSGTITGAPVSNVAITCAANTYTVGGTVTGLDGSMVLQNNHGDNLRVAVNGTFTFATAVASGNPYNVTVLTQPVSQTCSVNGGSGIASAQVNGVAVNCVSYRVFAGNDGVTGLELWKSDGSAGGTVLVNDINTTAAGAAGNSSPYNFTILNGVYYFVADDGVHGYELWKSDGTAAGTMLVKDINSTAAESSFPYELTVFNGALYFNADNGVNGDELWKSDGTAAGTVMVKDFNQITPAADFFPHDFVVMNGALYFAANDGINGDELWKSDGSAAGTVMVRDINTSTSSFPYELTVLNGALYFTADDGVNGDELWKSDGSAAGTMLVKDINPGVGGAGPGGFTAYNGALYFTAFDAVNGDELWKSDGSAAGTVLVKDVNSTASGAQSYPHNYSVFNGALYFVASDGVNGYELWKSDGTPSGTVMVKDINPSAESSWPDGLTAFNGALYFQARDGVNGDELWKSDGSAAGTVMVKDINTTAAGVASSPHNFYTLNGALYFTANDGVNGNELWKSNGTAPSTLMLKDMCPGYCNGLN